MVYNKVVEIICEQLDITDDKITSESTFDELDADSLDVVDVIMSLEDEYEIEIPDEEIEHMSTVGDLVDYIENHKG